MTPEPTEPPPASAPRSGRLSLLQVLSSVAASFFGVQSSRNRERDFSRGRALQFVVMGLIMTTVFVLTVWAAVAWVMRSAGQT
jgi:hypothetical protein